MLASDGRAGSYFGLTIRLDCYYKDFKHFFYILDLVFQKNILGDILNRKGDGFQYKVSKFADAKISDIESCIVNLIENCFEKEKVSTLSNVAESKTSVKSNIYDASEQKVKDAIQKGTIVSLSPYFPTKGQIEKEKNYEKQKVSLQTELENQKANEIYNIEMVKKQKDKEKTNEVDELKKQISSLKESNSSLSNQVSNLISTLTHIRQLLSNFGGPATPSLGKSGKSSKLDREKSGGSKSEEGTENEGTNTPTKEGGRTKSILNLFKNIQPFLVILVLIIVVALFARMPDNQQKPKNEDKTNVSTINSVPMPHPLKIEVFKFDEKTKEITGDALKEVEIGKQWYAARLDSSSTGKDSVKWTIEEASAGLTRDHDTLTFQVPSPTKNHVVRISCVTKDGIGGYKELKVKQ